MGILFLVENRTRSFSRSKSNIEGEPKVKDDQNKDKNTDETNEEGMITKNVKTVPDVDAYETTYFEFLVTSLQIWKIVKSFFKLVLVFNSIWRKSYWNGWQHQLALRSVILSVISDFSEEEISGSEGKNALSEKLLKEMNAKLESLKEFPGIEGVYFTSFVVQ